MERALFAFIAGLAALTPADAHAYDCDRLAVDLLDGVRRAHTILNDVEHFERRYADVIELYEEAIPSGPGFLGGYATGDVLFSHNRPPCTGGPFESSLQRTRWAVLARWQDPAERWGVALTLVGRGDRVDFDHPPVARGLQSEEAATVIRQQRYYGATMHLPDLELQLGWIDVDARHEMEAGVVLPWALPEPESGRLHVRVELPTFYSLGTEVVIGSDFDAFETALVSVEVPLADGFTSAAEAVWLDLESRAVLRLSLSDPWGVFTGDVGFETSTAFFRHARLRGRFVSDPLYLDGGRGFAGIERLAMYVRFGVEGELSRFSGRRFEEVTGESGLNGWRLEGMLAVHPMMGPVRMEWRVGAERNAVDTLEYAASMADRDAISMRITASMGW